MTDTGWKRALRDSEKRELEQAERLRDEARDNYQAVYRRLMNRCVQRLRRAGADKEQSDGQIF